MKLLFCLAAAFAASTMNAEDVSAILTKAPEWTSIRPADERTGRLLCETLRPLLSKEPQELRAELAKYVRAHEHDVDSVGALSRIFVLNRIYFDVPSEDRQADVENFGGWNGVPFGNGKINVMWPVGRDKAGRFAIVGHFGGYFGPDYRPLEEFDFFLKRYGKRKLSEN